MNRIRIFCRASFLIRFLTSTLGLAKQDLLGLGAESLCIVASYHFAKMIPQWDNHFGKRKACYISTL